MNWLNDFFGTNLPSGAQLVIIFVALLVLLLLAVWLLRKMFSNKVNPSQRSRQPRLTVTDAAIVDDKRRLVLVRRDNVEHLVMIGGPSDIVIEQNIHHTAAVVPVSASVPADAIEPDRSPQPVETEQPVSPQQPAREKKLEPELAPVAATPPKIAESSTGTPVQSTPAPEVDLSADRPATAAATATKAVEPVQSRAAAPFATPKSNGSHEPVPKVPLRKDDMAESLEELLTTDDALPKTTSKAAPEVTTKSQAMKTSVDDDMQKLLKELELETSRG